MSKSDEKKVRKKKKKVRRKVSNRFLAISQARPYNASSGHLLGAIISTLSRRDILHIYAKYSPRCHGVKGLVYFENQYSNAEPVFCDVAQGSILGPLLFILFINDFTERLEHSTALQFLCMPTTQFYTSQIKIQPSHLNQDMKNVLSYFQKKGLIINMKKGKTDIMLFGTSKRVKDAGGGILQTSRK